MELSGIFWNDEQQKFPNFQDIQAAAGRFAPNSNMYKQVTFHGANLGHPNLIRFMTH